ncbi:ATP-binding protein [Escherichia coli]|uniref:dTMP kinase n=1 Tax=Escherichia coli TaxID=562 RepID=UPI0007510D2C|nr:dTMP kinase [Escherichia coli]KUU82864.1 ATP-binding protein [Escherichia coli]
MQSITPPLIAVIGSDGSGKSTVCEHLITVVEKYGAAERVHLGKQAGNVGRAVTKLPLMGKSLHKTIERNQVKTAKKLPGPVPALVITAFVARRLLRFRHMLACRRRGLIVLTDRYPQVEVPGFRFDGPQLAKTTGGNGWIKMLRQRELKLYQWMASYLPVLLIRLGIDEQTAFARKPDHKRESLERKIAITPQLTFGGAQLVDIDANQPLEQVLVDAEKAITDFMTARGYH